MGEFRQEYLGQFPDSSQFPECAYLDAWLEYHRAANAIDGHIECPVTAEERRLCGMAGIAGNRAMKETLEKHGLSMKTIVDAEAWQKAKRRALHIIELERTKLTEGENG